MVESERGFTREICHMGISYCLVDGGGIFGGEEMNSKKKGVIVITDGLVHKMCGPSKGDVVKKGKRGSYGKRRGVWPREVYWPLSLSIW